MENEVVHSAIFRGQVRHRRFTPKQHSFNYSLYMLGIDLDEIEHLCQQSILFGKRWFNPMRFVEKDYVQGEPECLKMRISDKVESLGGRWNANEGRVLMLVQVRCFGLYFSPANFYFCYNIDGECELMLAEVSNTPWNEKHYYLVDMVDQQDTEKKFHVSPFMQMNMFYKWQIKAPKRKVFIHIENHQNNKVFDATMALSKVPFKAKALLHTWLSLPAMTVKICLSIYWQALKLFIKRVPFVPYQKHS